MTKELVSQEAIEKAKASVATQTINPVHNVSDPRAASELKKQLASYLESNKEKAQADEKLSDERMSLESSVTRYFAEEYKKQTEQMQRAVEQQHQASLRANEKSMKDAESGRKVSQTKLQGSAYLMSKQAEQAGVRAILQQEQSDLTAAHQRTVAEGESYISQMKALAASSAGPAQAEALNQVTEAQTKLAAAARQYNEELAKNKAAIQASGLETMKLNSSWGSFFAQAYQETKSLAATIRGELQSSMTQATNAFSQGIAKSLVEGKSFSKEMMSGAREMSESMISGLIRCGIQDVVTKMGMKATAASLAVGMNRVYGRRSISGGLNRTGLWRIHDGRGNAIYTGGTCRVGWYGHRARHAHAGRSYYPQAHDRESDQRGARE